MATVADRGRRRKERIAPRAFDYQLDAFESANAELAKAIEGGFAKAQIEALEQLRERRNVHVLAGHDFNRPLGSLAAGNARGDFDP